MALKVFNHGTSDLATAANWTGATLPVDGDDALIPQGAQANLTMSSTQAAIDLASLTIDEKCTSHICSSVSPYIINPIRIHNRGQGNFFFQSGTVAATVAEIIIEATPTSAGAIPTVELSGSTLTAAQVHVRRGNVTIGVVAGTAAIPRISVGYITNPSSDARLTLTSTLGITAYLEQRAGYVTASNTITDVRQWGGTLSKDTATITNYYGFGNAQCFFDFAGTIGVLELHDSAIMDWMRNLNVARVATLTRLFNQSVFKYLPNSALHTFTNAIRDYRQVA